jgi:hypothetical protein
MVEAAGIELRVQLAEIAGELLVPNGQVPPEVPPTFFGGTGHEFRRPIPLRRRGIAPGSRRTKTQSASSEPEAIQSIRLRLVSSPSTPTGRGSAQSAHETHQAPLQLLRRQRQLRISAASRRAGEAGSVQVAPSSESIQASHMDVVRSAVGESEDQTTDDEEKEAGIPGRQSGLGQN